MSARREYVAALVLMAVGSGLALLAAGRTWATATAADPGAPAVTVAVTGRELAPAVSALALVGLAGIVAVPSTRGVLRRLVGAVLAAAGAGIVVASVAVGRDAASAVLSPLASRLGVTRVASAATTTTPWWLVAVVGGALLLVAGAATALRGPRWSGMSARYDAPAGSGLQPSVVDRSSAGVWAALDRGEDPTAGADLPE